MIIPGQDIDPDTTIKELFSGGPITIEVVPHRGGKRTTMAISAPKQLNIVRTNEPISKSTSDSANPEELNDGKKSE